MMFLMHAYTHMLCLSKFVFFNILYNWMAAFFIEGGGGALSPLL